MEGEQVKGHRDSGASFQAAGAKLVQYFLKWGGYFPQ